MTDTAPQAAAAAPTAPAASVTMPIAKALNSALREAMRADEKVLLMGEDIGPLGGVFRITEGLHAEFGGDRVLDTPLAESGIIGTAIGLAMRGYRPVIEIQFDGFVYPGFDQIVSQLAKMTARHRGAVRMPVVIRIPYGGHIGAVEHHQESPEAYFAHTAGLRVVSPSTANDAHWMLRQAIESDDPVIFLEPKAKYWTKGEVLPAPAPGLEGVGGMHRAVVAQPGTDVTLIGHGAMVHVLLQAAQIAEREGTSCEVIDLRSLSPIDWEPLVDSARRTGRVVVAQEAPGHVSVGSEVAATIAERAFYSLEAPVLRVSGFDAPFPAAQLEDIYLPDADRVLDAVDRAMAY
ncbi:alpha-ketoacid dehydrogenase subunit beta [Agrococcus sp. KRD186]|uniref:alpha-ketoacid dehydrogenase subunit beta n=1 Tax=Agrococcus sp. KRD186 TaxID=2729730 RepID=UPI001F497CF7|nr:alpha-ketoacid dehydrogenase subunit beta [Agrococcus sp. KRD186]